MIGNNLLRYNLSESKFITIDFETESLSLSQAKPWSVGWQVYHGDKLAESHEYYLKWKDLEVSPEAAKHTHFNPQIIKDKGRDPKEIIDMFDKYLYNPEYKIVGANLLNYDVYIHNVARLELGYKTNYSYIDRIYDTISLSRAYKLGIKIPENKEDFLTFQYRMSNIKQRGLKASNSVMAKEFGYEIDESKVHGVKYDIELTWFVFMNLIKKIEIK